MAVRRNFIAINQAIKNFKRKFLIEETVGINTILPAVHLNVLTSL